jgi:hypothetical protein
MNSALIQEEPKVSGAEIRRHLHINSDRTLHRWRADGMPHYRYGPKLLRYRLSEVEAWLSNRKVRGGTKSLRRAIK